MKFLVDAQLPRRLAHWLVSSGHDAVHTLDLPQGNATSDVEICRISTEEERTVITKDRGFADSMMLLGEPHKLLLISTGNISNRHLENVFALNLAGIVDGLTSYDYVELTQGVLVFHL
jgi:predicted nuclease of predicted toxin-antitoxin system